MSAKERIIAAVEDAYGKVADCEEECPGVYYITCGAEESGLADELLVVERDCPHISNAAKSYGKPLSNSRLLIYDYNDDRSGRDVVLYEAYRYLTTHGLPLPDGNTLFDCAINFADYYPEYFGMTPAPVVTPCGFMTRYITLANGIFAVETSEGKRLVAVAGLIWSLELQESTIALGEKAAGAELPEELTYLFFSEQDGCLALFELWHGYPALRSCNRLDWRALLNAIWTRHPEYAVLNNIREQRGLNDMFGLALNEAGAEPPLHGSAANMVALSPEADTCYIRW